jgi:hypothetical protein
LYIEVVVGAVGSVTSLGIRVNGISSSSYSFAATTIGNTPATTGTSSGTSFTLVSGSANNSDVYVFRLPLYWNSSTNFKPIEGIAPQRYVIGNILAGAITQIDFITGGAFTGANIVATLFGIK